MKISILYIISLISLTRQEGCNHDTFDISSMIPSNFFSTYSTKYGSKKFTGSSAIPMRLTYEFSDFPNNLNSGVTNDDITNQFESLKKFISLFIKVIPRKSPIKNVSGQTQCLNYQYPTVFKNNGYYNTDFHIFIKFASQDSTNPPIVGWICELDPNPVAGVIMLNIQKIGSLFKDQGYFQKFFVGLLHQFIHLLGFSEQIFPYWIDPDTKQPYKNTVYQKIFENIQFGNKTTRKLKSFNVNYFIKNYYSCDKFGGMILENNPVVPERISHWELELVGNELMVENLFSDQVSTLTELTVALLKDTGFYDSINNNMVSYMYWGDNTCDLDQTCSYTSKVFEEFPKVVQDSCDFFSQGFIKSASAPIIPNSQCPISSAVTKNLCENDIENPPNENNRMNTGKNSRCFVSNAYKKGSNETTKYKCFKAQCKNNSLIEITLWEGVVISCTSSSTIIYLNQYPQLNSEGTINCPSNFNRFCNVGILCKNSCSNKGFCNKGVCFCLADWSGEDCSKQCSLQDNNDCVANCPSGKFKNPNNVCLTSCPTGFYPDTQTQTCQICHPYCTQCTGPYSNQCQACQSKFPFKDPTTCYDKKCDDSCISCSSVLSNNHCLSCKQGYYLETNNTCQKCDSTTCETCEDNPKKCIKCKDINQVYDSYTNSCNTPNVNCHKSCKTCSAPQSENSCGLCADGYIKNDTKNTCDIVCHSSCLTCSSPNDQNKCLSCKDGYFSSSNSSCKQCTSPCNTCKNDQQCLSCIKDYQINSQQQCEMKCDSSCKKCSVPVRSDGCTECYSGYFLTNLKQCKQCATFCKECGSQPNECLSCIDNYEYDSDNKKCKPVCDPPCSQCQKINSVDKCIKCESGYYLTTQNKCEKCLSPCKECSKQQNFCISCINSDYRYDDNTKTCNLLCDVSCETCQQANNSYQCLICAKGYFTKQSSKPFYCQKCQANCLQCSQISGDCQVCKDGYKIKGSTCIPQCHPSCLECNEPYNSFSCNSCQNGFYLVDNKCQKCESPCEKCNIIATQCTSCEQNYKLISGKCEFGCHLSCKSCLQTDDEQSCLTCGSGYYFEEISKKNSMSLGKCLACNQNCEKCVKNTNNDIQCLECKSGYEFDIMGNCTTCDQTCQTCFKPKDPQACLTCFSSKNLDYQNKCIECNNGKYFSTDIKDCAQCQEGCAQCTSGISCEKCQKGYTLNKENQCQKNYQCHYSCKDCTSSSFSSCSSCQESRIFQILNEQNQTGVCDCPNGTTDNGNSFCDNSILQKAITQTSKTSFLISTSVISAACKPFNVIFFLKQQLILPQFILDKFIIK